MARIISTTADIATLNYGYRSVPVPSQRVAGTILNGKRSRGQRKGDPFVRNRPAVVLLNIDASGTTRSVTVLNRDGSAAARLAPGAQF